MSRADETVLLMSNEHGDGPTVILSPEHLSQVLHRWYDVESDPVTDASISQVVEAERIGEGPYTDGDIYLGLIGEELHHSEVSLEQWTEWICGRWLTRGRMWSDGQVVVRMHKRPDRDGSGGWAWPGGPVLVKACHGETERSWRSLRTWAALRECIAAVQEEEQEALDAITNQAKRRYEAEQALRDAQAEVLRLQRELERAAQHRDEVAMAHLRADPDDDHYRYPAQIAQILGLSRPAISKLVARSKAAQPD